MYKIVCYVENEKLGDVYAMLVDNVARMDPPQLVVTAAAVPSAADGGSKLDVAAERLRKMGGRVDKDAISEAFKSLGINRTGRSYYINRLIGRKVLKRVARGTYMVVR